MKNLIIAILLTITANTGLMAQEKPLFQQMDVFQLEWAADPQISPDGSHIVYRRMGMNIMEDKKEGSLWLIGSDGARHRKLTSFDGNEHSAIWSPDGQRIAYVREAKHGSEIHIFWLETGQMARITQLEKSPSDLNWSADGTQITFTMMVAAKPPVIVKGPEKPKDAKWAKEPRITDRMRHEADGSGYIEPGFRHVFVVPSEGGMARQVTSGDYHHASPVWTPDCQFLICSGNRSDDWEYDFRNSEIYKVDVNTGETTALTTISGPDHSPVVSPDGNWIAYLGFEDKVQTYQTTKLRIMDLNGASKRLLSNSLDRSLALPVWDSKSQGLYFMYDEKGRTKIGYLSLSGDFKPIADNVGGTSMGRPYGGGSFSISEDNVISYTYTRPEHPADLAIIDRGKFKKLSNLNSDLLDYRRLGKVDEFWWKSSFDQRDIQGWIVKPADFDPSKKYPLIIENHGGPISNYGERFSPEIQLYASAGYVVFYPNPRGSTGYGEEFGNLLYHNYPGDDYDDIMSGMEALIEKGYIDEKKLYVTGGSAGGIMTAWMIGKSDRFRAAVVAKPVMNWFSKTLVADNWFYYYESRYPGLPWTNVEDYMKFSPISLGNINCPTMVIVGMEDLRTPVSEAKQLYHALKYRKIETVLVEILGAYHNISKRPSQLISKVAHVIAWFEKYNGS